VAVKKNYPRSTLSLQDVGIARLKYPSVKVSFLADFFLQLSEVEVHIQIIYKNCTLYKNCIKIVLKLYKNCINEMFRRRFLDLDLSSGHFVSGHVGHVHEKMHSGPVIHP
jgi:hypothetical protein